jgi:hypothetical protein
MRLADDSMDTVAAGELAGQQPCAGGRMDTVVEQSLPADPSAAWCS